MWRTGHDENFAHLSRAKFSSLPRRLCPTRGFVPLYYTTLAQRVGLCHCITPHSELSRVVLVTDEKYFTRDGINNERNLCTWSLGNQHKMVGKFQRFSVTVWCGMLVSKLLGPLVVWQQFNMLEVFLPEEWVARFLGRPPSKGKWSNILPAWKDSPILHVSYERWYMNLSITAGWFEADLLPPRSPTFNLLISVAGAKWRH